MIERFLRLKTSEAVAIRWHMGGFDDAARAGNFAISLAYDKYPIAVKLHLADLEATYLREKVLLTFQEHENSHTITVWLFLFIVLFQRKIQQAYRDRSESQ